MQRWLTAFVVSTTPSVDQMPLESSELCACREPDHTDGRCLNPATAIDGLCNGCRAAKELATDALPKGHLLARLGKLFR